jgi:hypothetical protein
MDKIEQDFADRSLLVEPVTRPDGIEIKVWGYGDHIQVHAALSADYSKNEVELLGNGDFSAGLELIGKAHFNADPLQLGAGNRLLNDQLRKLKETR